MELEREKNDVLIIAHETVLRCLYAYLFDRPASVSKMDGFTLYNANRFVLCRKFQQFQFQDHAS